MPDLRPDLREAQEPGQRSTPRISGRTVLFIAVGLVAALVAVLIVVLTRPSSGGGGGIGFFPVSPTSGPPKPSAGAATSAAVLQNWGEPAYVDEFDKPLGSEWEVYNGKGHNGNGQRSPDAVSIADGIMTITGDENGKTAGMALTPGHKYGRWEARVKAPVGDDTYNALLLLWPDAEDWPVGGEVDFMEMDDATRQTTSMFLHYGKDNEQDKAEVKIDGTQWHNWAVDWTPDHVIAYVDGKEWYRTTDKGIFPPRKMHLAIQLDWFPENGNRNNVKPTTMAVDWVKQYAPPGVTP